ncbi:MAG: hypothetical protein M0023_11195 [Desulfobacteraceae bacterium]|nr:hypothetical protein [Desulfobacteraceae bacterium]
MDEAVKVEIAAHKKGGDMQTETSSTEAMFGAADQARPAATLADLLEIVSTLPRLDGDDMNFLNTEDVQLEVL